MEIVLGILLILASVFLIVAVLLQQGKSRNLSGAIGGGTAETFFGKTKSDTFDKKLSRLTTIVAVVFVILVIVMYLAQDTSDYSGYVAPDTSAADNVDTGDGVDLTTDAGSDAGVDGTDASASGAEG